MHKDIVIIGNILEKWYKAWKNTNLGHFTQVSITTKADNKSKKNEIYKYIAFTQVLRQTNEVGSKKDEG